MKIFVYAQHTSRAAEVYLGDEPESLGDDLTLHASGDSESIIAQMIESLGTRHDKRPGGNGDNFRWNCDRNTLAYLGAPAVEYDPQAGVFRPVAVAE